MSSLDYTPFCVYIHTYVIQTIAAGFFLLFLSVASFVFSKLGAKKLLRIYEYVAAGTEGEEMEAKFSEKYDELVPPDSERHMGAEEVVKLANQAGRKLANSERHAIQAYLDESCHGFVTKDDFMKQFLRLKENKQRFL